MYPVLCTLYLVRILWASFPDSTTKATTGSIGTSLRRQYSITGEVVIIASRIEQLNKAYDSQLLISKEVLDELERDGVEKESLGEVRLKGIMDPVSLYRIL